tara:strand:- start:693 stop:1274 length:582 start_codon:yes stop_codon:yes gene_type:complete
MIYFIDDFLPSYILDETIKDLSAQNYQELKTDNESFHYLMAKPSFIKYTIDSLEKLEGNKITSILNWFRLSNDKIQDNWKIHSDGIIQGQKPDRALVLYISPKKKKDLHGTAFWEHKKHGKSLPYDTPNEEFDRMILKDSEDLSVWTLNTVVGYEQNRAISYPANYFHSKYPNKSWKEGREVFVMFYKTEIKK